MVKRKCGTCRHFKDGGIAGSGWCQHPSRKDIQHMVLVRKTELACRNSWDQDLWELAEQPLDLQHSTDIPIPIGGGEQRDVQVAQIDMTVDDAARAGEMFTDRITSISMPTRSQLRPASASANPSDSDATAGELQAARSSVRDARKRRQEQRHLERRKHQETILQQAGDLLDRSEPEQPVDRDLARIRADEGPMTANRQRRREPSSADQPPIAGSTYERARQAPTPSVEFGSTPQRFRGAGTPPTSPEPERKPQPAPKPATNGHRAHASLERSETEPLPSPEEIRQAIDAHAPSVSPTAANAPTARPAPRRHIRTNREPADLPPAVEPRRTNWVTAAGHLPLSPVANLPGAMATDPIERSDAIAEVRRCCATCRDFKQVGDGRTGWCTNPYAFAERRMVQSEEIACRSSLGVWWLPHDGLWLEQADTTHHGRPTPLLDEVLGSTASERESIDERSSR